MNIFRAVMVTGSPGIGKTTSAHLVAKLEGFTPIELNASDARSKKLVEVRYSRYCAVDAALTWSCALEQNSMNINNKSLDGWMGGSEVPHTSASLSVLRLTNSHRTRMLLAS